MGFPAGIGSGSFMSTTTQSDIKNVFATEDACSRQHLTTCLYREKSDMLKPPDMITIVHQEHLNHESIYSNIASSGGEYPSNVGKVWKKNDRSSLHSFLSSTGIQKTLH